jgi:hypothetical protein
MTMPQQHVLTEAERVRRSEMTIDTRAALALGLTLDEFIERRQKSIDDWCQWLHCEMAKSSATDPVELLPEIATRIEQRCATASRDAAKAVAQETVRLMLGRAMK